MTLRRAPRMMCSTAQQPARAQRSAQGGFSLLEMLIAIGIMSAAAYVALDTVDSDTSRTRFDLTENRLATIRRAIVGDRNITVNGSPMLSGYVYDVGSLPPCLEALLTRTTDCDGDGTNEVVPLYAETVAGLKQGWRGPYLTASASAGYPDAWGNVETTALGTKIVGINYGWENAHDLGDFSATAYNVSSLGNNRTDDSGGGDDQGMVGIVDADYDVDLADYVISVTIENGREPDSTEESTFCAAILSPKKQDPNDFEIHVGAGPLVLADPPDAASAPVSQTITFNSSDKISAGRRILIVYDVASSAVTNSDCTAALDTADFAANLGDSNRATKPFLAFPRTPLSLSFTVVIP